MKNSSNRHRRLVPFRCFTILALIAIAASQIHGGPCTPPASGLVGWWPGEGDANDIIGGDNGTLEGGATFAPGKVGQGFRFDGTNGYVQIPDSAALKPTNVTCEAWVWLDPGLPPHNGGEQIVFKKNTWTAWFEGYSLIKDTIDNGDGTYSDRFQFCVSRSGNQVAINSQTIAQRGVWYHVAGTYDGNQSKLYVNGVLEASATPGFPLDYDTTPIFIGTSGTWAPYLDMFGGIIDEVSIYNRALSDSEIAAIYNAGSAGKCSPTSVPCTPPPAGLVDWWPGEGNANDVIGGNNGQVQNITYAGGVVGDAFYLNGSNAYVKVAASSNLDVGAGNGFTFETWINPANLNPQVLAEWNANSGDSGIGAHFWISEGKYFPGPAGCLYANLIDTGDGDHYFSTGGGVIVTNAYQHIALTYDKTSGTAVIYWNGTAVQTSSLGTFNPQTSFDFYLGERASGAGPGSYFDGIMDEPSLYNRALSAAEIAAIYNAGNMGKCAPAPSGVPAISNFSPTVGTSGTLVAISGNNFNPNIAGNIVYFGAVQANVLLASPTNLMAMVPAGATYAPITVNVGGLTAYSAAPFMPTFPGNGSGISTSSFSSPFNLPTLNGPSQTVIADIDGDGKPDIIVVDGYNNSISIFRNISTNGTLSAGSFAPRVDLPATGGTYSPFSITVADVDGDGKLDIIATEDGDNLVSVYRNNCTPGNIASNLFTRTDYPTGSGPAGVVARDLDGDGRPDIVVCNGGDGTISILQNTSSNGIVSFAPKVDFAAGGGCQHVAAGDLNGDGKPDLAAINGDGTLSLFQNQIAGPGVINTNSFAPAVSLAIPTGGVAVAIVDVDGDGKPDLATTAYLPQIFSVFQNIGTGGNLTTNSFGPRMDFPMDGRGHTIAVGDLDGDGKPDLIVDTELNSLINIFRNTSASNSLSLASQIELSTGWNAWGVSVGDLDGDGRPDIVFANTYDNTITIYQNQTPLAVNPPSTNLPAITAIVPNIAMPGTVITISGTNFSPIAASNVVYFGAVQATVSSASPITLLVTVPSGATYAPVTVTVNGLTAYAPQPFEPIFPGAGQIDNSSLAPLINLPTGNGPGQVVIADLDGDGRPDLIVPDSYAGEVSIYQNISTNGSLTVGSFAPRVVLPLLPTSGTNPYRVVAADLDGDGRLDLVVLNPDSNAVSILKNIGSPGSITTNSFAARIDLPGGNVMRGLAVQDLNGDGLPEIVTANDGDNTISIFQNLSTVGNIAFAARVDLPAGNGSQSVVIGDLDGDGFPDLVVGNWNDSTISVFRNTGVPGNITTNSFAPRVDFPSVATPFPIAIGDLDGDGKLDLVVGGSENSSTISVYRNTSTAGSITTNSFAPHVDFAAPGWVNSIALADLDGDGKLDIALVSQLSSVFSIFKNVSQPGSFTTASLAGRVDYASGWNPNGVAVGDLDGDGQPDIVFANSYDNNIYIYRNLVPLATGPVITSQPTNEIVAVGDIATFTVAAGGTAPLNYQWSLNLTNLSGATNATLTISNVQLEQTGNYSVVVSNLVGVAISSNAVLTVFVPTIPPSILSQTPNQVVLLGNTATFSVNAGGSDPLSYLWQRNGALIPGATNASYSLLNAQLSDSGSKFSCLVTNAYGSASSTNASLKVIDTMANDLCSGAIIITNACYTNTQSTLKASAFGDPEPDCVDGFGHGVWYQFTAPVAGLLIVDTFGSDFDTGLAIYTGSCDSLAELACNDDFNGVTSQVAIPTTAGTTYSILVGGYDSDAGNLVLHLNHLTPPAFAVQPTNQIAVAGSNAVFTAVLDGTRPLSYQWLLDGNPLSDNAHYGGSTMPSLTISNVTTADAIGNFSVTVSNILGSATSTAVNLSVLSITTQPVGRSVPPGLPTTFTATASPSPAPSYQWQLNGTNIPSATNASYTIPAVGTNDLGFYHLLATYPVGVAASADAQLTFGPVAAWGLNTSGECLPPPNLSNVIAVAGSSGASFAIRADGKIVSWGGGSVTNIPAGASNVVAVSISPGSLDGAAALRTDGTVAGWGSVLPPMTLSNIVSVAVGDFRFGFALRAEGTLVGWGAVPYSMPPPGLNHVTAIACGYTHSLALRNDGTVVAWGSGPATNVPAGLANVTAIAAGYSHSLVLKSNGTVVAWGSGSGTNLPAGLTNIMAISASGSSQNQSLSLALRANGMVVAWGDNVYGEKIPPAALSNLVSIAIAAASYHGLALVNDGSPVILHPPVGLTADTGRDVTLQAAAAGAAPLSYQWLLNGANISGATNTSLFIPNVQLGSAGNYQLFVSNYIGKALSLAAPLNVLSNSALTFLIQPAGQTNYQGSKVTLSTTVLGSGPLRYQWYYSPTNIIYGATYIAVTGATNDTLVLDPALASNTGLYYVAVSNQLSGITSMPTYERVLFARAWGYNAVSNPPVNVTNAIALAMSYSQNANSYFALGANGKLTAWAGLPVQYGETNVAPLSNSFVTAIAAGQQDVLALKSDGTVYAWGSGQYGQTNPPTGLSGVIGIACGAYHDLALKADGTVVGWGANLQFNYGQATNNPAATNVVAIAAAQYRSLALRADGTVVSWGYGLDGTGVVPPNVINAIAITAGTAFNAALRADGKVVQWGSGLVNYPVPANLSNVVAISGSSQHCTALKNDGTVVSWGLEIQVPASNNVPADLANVIAITSGGEQDMALFGTRAPAFTVQPWDRAFPLNAITNILLAAKCAGVQPVLYQWQLNGTNVPSATNDTLLLTNNPFVHEPRDILPTGAYQLIASNAYGVAASKYAKITTYYPLADALDTTNSKGSPLYNWTTSGNAQWFGETNVTHDGVDAAQSGGIGALQETILQTTVGTNWSGRYTFWWKVSSEQDFDFLEFRVNGITQASISGQVDWQPVSIPVAMGTNVLQWRYSKDATFDFGQDAGWVDQFAFIPDPPLITAQPVSQTVNMGTNVTMQVTAIGPPFLGGPAILKYQWRQNGNPVGGNSPSLVLNNVGRAQSGTYFVTVTNLNIPNNSIISSNAILKVLVPQLLGAPLLLPDGSFRLTSTDADGGLLSPSDLANFEAQASTNLLNWVTLPNALSLTNGMLLLQDGTQSNYPTRFYRLLEH